MTPAIRNAGPIKLIIPRRFNDERGFVFESYSERDFTAAGITERFVQDNHTLSRPKNTIRGLHFQSPPHAQAKLVRCLRGAIFDVVVDLRRGSPSYGFWVAARLDHATGVQLYVHQGFAHGYCTLEADTEVAYKVSSFYAPGHEGGVNWNDSDLSIDWPLAGGSALLAPKDQTLPLLADFISPFQYDGQPLTLPSGTVLAMEN